MGILFAPDKGEKTRKRIKDAGGDYAGDLKGKFDSIVETLSKKYDTLKDTLKQEGQGLYNEGKSKFEAIKTSFKEIGIATFLTSLTTSIGFFSLLFTDLNNIIKAPNRNIIPLRISIEPLPGR
jgi:gas vesicle protein